MSNENNLSLLRPFDLEAAKRGAIVQWYRSDETLVYVGPSMVRKAHCLKLSCGAYYIYDERDLRTAPLFWCECKPVYKGDVLYSKTTGRQFIVGEYYEENNAVSDESSSVCISVRNFTWAKPVVKIKKEGWINLYENDGEFINAVTSSSYISEEIAKRNAWCDHMEYTKTIHVEWEVEE